MPAKKKITKKPVKKTARKMKSPKRAKAAKTG